MNRIEIWIQRVKNNWMSVTLMLILLISLSTITIGVYERYGGVRLVWIGVVLATAFLSYLVISVVMSYRREKKRKLSAEPTPGKDKKGWGAWRWLATITVLIVIWVSAITLIQAEKEIDRLQVEVRTNGEYKASAKWHLTWKLPAGQYTAGGMNTDTLEVEIEDMDTSNVIFCTIGYDSHNTIIRSRYRTVSQDSVSFDGPWIELGGESGGTISLIRRDKGFYFGTMTLDGTKLTPTVTLENKPTAEAD